MAEWLKAPESGYATGTDATRAHRTTRRFESCYLRNILETPTNGATRLKSRHPETAGLAAATIEPIHSRMWRQRARDLV